MVKVPGGPFGIAVSNDGCWMFVSTRDGKRGGDLVARHDTGGTYSIDRTVDLGSVGTGEALTSGGQLLVVTRWTGVDVFAVSKLEGQDTNALVGVLNTGKRSGAVYAAISPNDRLLFVSEEHADRIAVYDLQKWRADTFHGNPLVGYVPGGDGPVGLAFSPNGHWLYATSEAAMPRADMRRRCVEAYYKRRQPEGLLLRISITQAAVDPARSVTNVMKAECSPVRVAVSPDGRHIWVTARGSGDVLRIDAGSFRRDTGATTYQRFAVGGEPVGIAVRPDGQQVWVGLSDRFVRDRKNADRQLVGLLINAGAKPKASVELVSEPAFDFPRQLHFLPDGRTLAVGLFGAKRIEFIATPP